MINSLLRVVLLMACLGAPAANAGSAVAEPAASPFMQGLNEPAHHEMHLGDRTIPFHIFVRLPHAYDETNKDYPTIYLLDGGVTFPALAGYTQYLNAARDVPDIIVVGISYGASSFEDGNLRGSDFTASAESRAHYGGAPAFQAFLKSDLIPMIEKTYRSDPNRRVIFGQSLGGQFALHAAQTEPDLFWGYIASNPALHRNLDYFLEFHGDAPTTSPRLFVSDGELDADRFRIPALQWMDHWNAIEDRPWALKTTIIKGENHFSTLPAAYRQGLMWLFDEE